MDSLEQKYYKYPAIVPAMPWKDSIPPLPPDSLKATVIEENNIVLKWQTPSAAPDGELPAYYVVFRFENELSINTEDASKILAIQTETFLIDKNLEKNKRFVYVIKYF
ncbi:MAG: glycoside hydrolase, partial [Raineya sp.]